ncbi:MAG: PqqD family protein [Bacteroidales bacterium]|nr:PqqD family protein [Bacteroidales bacterium]
MKTAEGFKLRKVLGESVIVAEGVSQVNFNKLISLNKTAAALWESIEGKEFCIGDLVKVLTDNYEIDEETARRDVEEIVSKWQKLGLVI